MNFFERYNAASAGQQAQADAGLFDVGSTIGQGLLGLTGQRLSQQVAEEAAKTRGMATKENMRRAARDALYQQELQLVQNASLGNSQFGSMLSVFAQDEQVARERVLDIALRSQFDDISEKQQTFGNSGTGLLSALASAGEGLSSIFVGLNNE